MTTSIRHRPPFPSGWSSFEISPSNLTLANTLPVGQSFLWHRHQLLPPSFLPHPPISDGPVADPEIPTEEFSRAIHSPPRVICLRQTSSRIYYTALYPDPSLNTSASAQMETQSWIRDYFQLDKYPDLKGMYDDWKKRDPGLFGRLHLDFEGLGVNQGGRARGIRVLRQDPWECLIAFITSTNNHIPRISGLMHRLSTHFSPPLLILSNPTTSSLPIPDEPCPGEEEDTPETTTYHLFPPPHMLPTKLEQILRELGFGYRAGFIECTLASLRAEFGDGEGEVERGLEGWRGGDEEVVREKLVALKGVGRKVADCVMLMCLDQPHLIPIDTHLSATASRHPSFPSRLKNKPMSKVVYDEVQEFLLDKWGPMGGWAQAVMFAADLKETTIKLGTGGTPKKTSTPVKTPRRDGVKDEGYISPERVIAGSDFFVVSNGAVKSEDGTNETGPMLETRGDQALNGNSKTPGSAKRKAEKHNSESDSPPSPSKDRTFTVPGLPAGYGFKRTRSAARIELQRQSSGASVLAEHVKGLVFQ